MDKYKARLIVKGYAKKYGVDYNEVFSHVARWDTIRLVIAMTAQKGWNIYQLDVKSAFLHGKLKEVVYVEQPQGFEKKDEENKVYKLEKALYGLKQAPRAWYSRIDTYFTQQGFERCPSEPTLFVKNGLNDIILIVSLYVDDLIVTRNDANSICAFKTSMMLEFEMTDLGKIKYFLGVEVLQSDNGIFITQRKYANEILVKFGMIECNSVKNPIVPGMKLVKDEMGTRIDATEYKRIVGSLRYLTVTRPDLMFVVGLVSRYMENPTENHLAVVKRVLRYVKGTTEWGLLYKKGSLKDLIGFTDSDYAGDYDDMKSTSGYVFLLGEGAVSWSSKKQPIVTLSTTEAEFVAAATCSCQAIWIKRILSFLSYPQKNCITLYCDNASTIKLSKNAVLHGRSKHIHIRYHFIRDLCNNGEIELIHCTTEEQLADVMTKAVKLDAYEKMRKLMGMKSFVD